MGVAEAVSVVFRKLAIIAALLIVGWTAGILMQASHVPTATQTTAACIAAAGYVLIGIIVIRIRKRGQQ